MVFYCFCICGRLFWPWVVSAERLLGSLIISRESDVRWVCVWERKKGGLVGNRRGSEYCTLLYGRNSQMCKCVWACLRLALRTSGYPNQLSWWWDERMWRLLPGNCFQSATVLLYLKQRNFHCSVCVCVTASMQCTKGWGSGLRSGAEHRAMGIQKERQANRAMCPLYLKCSPTPPFFAFTPQR